MFNMSVKTITVTENAYEALKKMKEPNESFSDIILRVAKRRPLDDFFGVLSKESGDRLEKAIMKARKRRNLAHKERIKKISKDLSD